MKNWLLKAKNKWEKRNLSVGEIKLENDTAGSINFCNYQI